MFVDQKPLTPCSGVRIFPRNSILHREGFYLSYNPNEYHYGGASTAIVVGKCAMFYILRGDHREALARTVGLEDTLQYFLDNLHMMTNCSDALYSKITGGYDFVNHKLKEALRKAGC